MCNLFEEALKSQKLAVVMNEPTFTFPQTNKGIVGAVGREAHLHCLVTGAAGDGLAEHYIYWVLVILETQLTNMINKIVGYSGFQSYGQLPYATIKPGKDKMPDDKIWQSTSRDVDNKPHLENYHHFKTIYKKDYTENTFPEHYHPNIVQRGSTGFKDFPKQNTIRTYQKLESSTIQQQQQALADANGNPDSLDDAKNKFLQTGTEHWKSNYKHQVDDILGAGKGGAGQPGGTGYGLGAGDGSGNKDGKGGELNADGSIRVNVVRSSSANNRAPSADLYKPSQPEWSKNDFAHFNRAPIGVTDYKFNYGQKIGHAPKPHIMDEDSTCQPRLYHPLKAGTTQLVEHIPGYQGHIPASKTIGKAFEHGKGTFTRTTFLKNNLVENYHVNVPGYSGFKTRANLVADDKLRASCFRTNEFINHQS